MLNKLSIILLLEGISMTSYSLKHMYVIRDKLKRSISMKVLKVAIVLN